MAGQYCYRSSTDLIPPSDCLSSVPDGTTDRGAGPNPTGRDQANTDDSLGTEVDRLLWALRLGRSGKWLECAVAPLKCRQRESLLTSSAAAALSY